MLYKATEKVITLFDDNTKQNMENPSMLQMLQRLLIGFEQVKAGHTSNSLNKWNQTNHIFFTSSKTNYLESI